MIKEKNKRTSSKALLQEEKGFGIMVITVIILIITTLILIMTYQNSAINYFIEMNINDKSMSLKSARACEQHLTALILKSIPHDYSLISH